MSEKNPKTADEFEENLLRLELELEELCQLLEETTEGTQISEIKERILGVENSILWWKAKYQAQNGVFEN